MQPAFYDTVHLLFKRKRIITVALVLILGPVALTTLSRRPVYRAVSRIMVTQARAYPQLSPQPEQRRDVPVNDVRLIAATVEGLRARSFLREVGNALALDGKPGNGDTPKTANWWSSRLASRLEVTPHANAPLIEVAYSAADPASAASVVNSVVDRYVGYHARAMFDNPTLQTFYAERRTSLERDLGDAEEALTRFQEENGILNLEVQKAQLARVYSETIQALDLNAGHIRQAEVEAEALSAHLQKLPAQVTLHSYGEGPRLTALNAKVVAIELELNNLRQLYTDDDRRVKNLADQLALAQEMLIAEEAATGQLPTLTRLESNDAYQNILENSLRQEAAAKALRARREEIEQSVAATAERLDALNRVSPQYERLAAEREAKQVSYQQFLKLIEQARSSEAMDREGLTNVRILDHADVPAKPVPGRRGLTIALGLLTSLTVGIAGAFGLEAFSATVHGERDGEQRLALPVLAVIPEDA